jgi:hypothetical protein
MIIAGIELERASVIKGIVILYIGKLRGKRDGPLPLCLAVEDLDNVPVRLQGGGEIGKTYRLRPYRCPIEIADGRLDKEDLHFSSNKEL